MFLSEFKVQSSMVKSGVENVESGTLNFEHLAPSLLSDDDGGGGNDRAHALYGGRSET